MSLGLLISLFVGAPKIDNEHIKRVVRCPTTFPFCRTLDLDGNGFLDFKENLMAMDLANAKTSEAKLRWAFNM